ncbi:enoyl-CoA hydratase-related protein, partial [Bradyrhizobium diversitatis]|uniref:enoyl-CoA hydratase-related protein n=1 Tax=Bradyrhizobium diversitatis TaxID=2755406 RepID=UPI00289AE83A
VEWFVHPWELGPRKAKEFLFTADSWSAQEAHQLGMVNQVVPRAELSSRVLELARRIATKPSFALKLTKEAVNRSVDVMGQPAACARRDAGPRDRRSCRTPEDCARGRAGAAQRPGRSPPAVAE